jgi:hypothetical protein
VAQSEKGTEVKIPINYAESVRQFCSFWLQKRSIIFKWELLKIPGDIRTGIRVWSRWYRWCRSRGDIRSIQDMELRGEVLDPCCLRLILGKFNMWGDQAYEGSL